MHYEDLIAVNSESCNTNHMLCEQNAEFLGVETASTCSTFYTLSC